MDPADTHKSEALEYDRQARRWGWNPEVVFGMMWEYVQPGDSLLEIGIGTGLCAEPFCKAGLRIYGFDVDAEMLRVCRSKGIAEDLVVHNIMSVPWPYADKSMDHALSAGVLHFFGDLGPIFIEAARIIKDGGTFGLLVLAPTDENASQCITREIGFAGICDDASGMLIYKHSESYVGSLLQENGFLPKKTLTFLASVNPDTKKEHYARLFIAGKTA